MVAKIVDFETTFPGQMDAIYVAGCVELRKSHRRRCVAGVCQRPWGESVDSGFFYPIIIGDSRGSSNIGPGRRLSPEILRGLRVSVQSGYIVAILVTTYP